MQSENVGLTVEHLLADLRRSYEGNAWHGPSVKDAIRGVSAAQASARPLPGAHTIYELAHHIAAWMGEAASRFRGHPPGMPADGDFPPPDTTVDELAWNEVQGRLARRHTELMESVAHFDPARLDDAVNPKRAQDADGPASFRALASGVAQHNTYHAGQIMLLRRSV